MPPTSSGTSLQGARSREPTGALRVVLPQQLLDVLASKSQVASCIPRTPPLCLLPRPTSMTEELPTQRVEVCFVGAPPAQQVERASGVSEVEIDGPILGCLVCGSFQPFLEARAVMRSSASGQLRRMTPH
jgi:hypothetical protein